MSTQCCGDGGSSHCTQLLYQLLRMLRLETVIFIKHTLVIYSRLAVVDLFIQLMWSIVFQALLNFSATMCCHRGRWKWPEPLDCLVPFINGQTITSYKLWWMQVALLLWKLPRKRTGASHYSVFTFRSLYDSITQLTTIWSTTFHRNSGTFCSRDVHFSFKSLWIYVVQ